MKRLIQLGLATAALAGTGCMGDPSPKEPSSSGGGSTFATADGSPEGEAKIADAKRKGPAPGKTIATVDSQYGEVLFSKSGRAIYYFDKESGLMPECYGSCAEAWPPVLTAGRPRASGSVKRSLLGTTKRANGKKQVTYKGHPLYFYVGDPKGEVECHNVEEFGGLWLAVQPDGEPVA